MADTMPELHTRLSAVSEEIRFRERQRRADLEKAFAVLQGIDSKTIELLEDIVPDLSLIAGYSLEQLDSNESGELRVIQNVLDTLRSFADYELKRLEDLL